MRLEKSHLALLQERSIWEAMEQCRTRTAVALPRLSERFDVGVRIVVALHALRRLLVEEGEGCCQDIPIQHSECFFAACDHLHLAQPTHIYQRCDQHGTRRNGGGRADQSVHHFFSDAAIEMAARVTLDVATHALRRRAFIRRILF